MPPEHLHWPTYTPHGETVTWTCSCGRASVADSLRAARSAHTRHLKSRLRHERPRWVAQHTPTFFRRPDGLWVWECSCGRWSPSRSDRPSGSVNLPSAKSGHTRHAQGAASKDISNRLRAVSWE